MKKLTIILFLTSACFQFAFSQSELFVQGEKGNLYLLHKVVAKENWYSVGRLFNVSPKEIAPFNNSSLTVPLTIGQELKIPLTETNFSQTAEKNADESLIPIYQGSKTGTRKTAGYLKVKTSLSSFAANAKNITPATTIKESVRDETTVTPPKEIKKIVAAPEKKQVVENNTGTAENKIQVKNNSSYHGGSGGFFIGEYNEGTRSTNGTAGTFKSTSGWQDGKYYALMNNVQVGTIIKVIAPATQKSVYAKVLGQLPDMKESEGLTVRISNAAANELGEPEGKFSVQVRY